MAYGDTLTQGSIGWVVVPGLSGIRGHSDTGICRIDSRLGTIPGLSEI